MKEITMDQAVEQFKSGSRMLLGEYRHGKVETINYRDKTSGKPASFTSVRHTVEIGDDSFLISERVPDNFDQSQWSPPCVKGRRCVVKFDKFTVQNGVGQFGGTVLPLAEKK
jgi:hypothetical protein